jgi:hypothetical protein
MDLNKLTWEIIGHQGLKNVNTSWTIKVNRSFFFSSQNIYILILKTLIIQKQEQTLIFIEFKAISFIYYNSHLKLLTLSSKSL